MNVVILDEFLGCKWCKQSQKQQLMYNKDSTVHNKKGQSTGE